VRGTSSPNITEACACAFVCSARLCAAVAFVSVLRFVLLLFSLAVLFSSDGFVDELCAGSFM
jgi:hypothetical protein